MTFIVSRQNVYYEDRQIFQAPAEILWTAFLDNSIIVLYDGDEVLPHNSHHGSSQDRKPTKQELFEANKNIVRLDSKGNALWYVKAGSGDDGTAGYRSIFKSGVHGWTVNAGKYKYRLNIETGETDMI